MRVWNLIHWWPSDSLLFRLQTSKIIAHKFLCFYASVCVDFFYAWLNWVTCSIRKKQKFKHHKETTHHLVKSLARYMCNHSHYIVGDSLHLAVMCAYIDSAQIKLSLIYMAVKCHRMITQQFTAHIYADVHNIGVCTLNRCIMCDILI